MMTYLSKHGCHKPIETFNFQFVSVQFCLGECKNLQELNISECVHVTVSKNAFSFSIVLKSFNLNLLSSPEGKHHW